MWIGHLEFSRACGVSNQTVSNFEKKKLLVIRKAARGKKEIDVDASAARILEHPGTKARARIRAAYETWCKGRGRPPFWKSKPAPPGGRPAAGALDEISATEAHRRAAVYDAELTLLKLERERGKYVEADHVRAALRDIGIMTQKALLVLPGRVVPTMRCADPFAAEKYLADEIRHVLHSLADSLKRLSPA